MSRIGKKPIQIPSGVKVVVIDGSVNVEGAKHKLAQKLPPHVAVEINDGVLTVVKVSEAREAKAMHGLTRSLIANMVDGVTKGFKKDLEIVGVGYKAQLTGSKLNMALGYSHPIVYDVPSDIKVTVTDNTKISVEGADKRLVGEVAAAIRRFKKPEPYKGKGIRYVGEYIAMKEGKTVG